MSVKSIKRLLRDSVYDHMTTQMSAELTGVQVVKAFAGSALGVKHIRISTPTASPYIVGARNTGRWTVACHITVVTQTDDIDEDENDDLVGLVEAYILQGNEILSDFLTNSEIAVKITQPGESSEVEINSMRYSAAELICECYMKAVE